MIENMTLVPTITGSKCCFSSREMTYIDQIELLFCRIQLSDRIKAAFSAEHQLFAIIFNAHFRKVYAVRIVPSSKMKDMFAMFR